MAKLIPLSSPKRPRKPGGWKGKMRIAKNFDEPLPEPIQTILEGRSHEEE